MKVLWQAKGYREDLVVSTYVELYTNGEVKVYDVNLRGSTLREWHDPSPEERAGWPELSLRNQILVRGMTLEQRQAARKGRR